MKLSEPSSKPHYDATNNRLPKSVPDISVLGLGSFVLFTGFAYVVGLVPFALFTSYVLRSAAISFRTLAAGPFILKDDGKRGRIDWD